MESDRSESSPVRNRRAKDNLILVTASLSFAALAGLVGGLSTLSSVGILRGCLLGLVIGGVVSGGTLMIVDRFRTA